MHGHFIAGGLLMALLAIAFLLVAYVSLLRIPWATFRTDDPESAVANTVVALAALLIGVGLAFVALLEAPLLGALFLAVWVILSLVSRRRPGWTSRRSDRTIGRSWPWQRRRPEPVVEAPAATSEPAVVHHDETPRETPPL